MKPCPKCEQLHTKPGTFCSRACANSRGPMSEETKAQRSDLVRQHLAINPRTYDSEHHKAIGLKGAQAQGKKAIIPNTICSYCSGPMEPSKIRKTCSDVCATRSRFSRSYQNGSRKTFYYNGVLLESSWELKLAKHLDSLGIKWIRPDGMNWTDSENTNRVYYPDFYLPDYDLYLDPKNLYCMRKDEEKMSVISTKVKIIYGDIQHVISSIDDIGQGTR